jgi:hypothetical protein
MDVSLKACNKCHTTPYCGKDCQKAHFKTHKKVCAALAQEYVKNHEPKMASRAASKSNDRNTGYKKWEVSHANFATLCHVTPYSTDFDSLILEAGQGIVNSGN